MARKGRSGISVVGSARNRVEAIYAKQQESPDRLKSGRTKKELREEKQRVVSRIIQRDDISMGAVFEDIVATDYQNPAYIFSSAASFDSYWSHSRALAEKTQSSLDQNKKYIRDEYYKNVDRAFKAYEENIAIQLCDYFGVNSGSDARISFQKYYQDQILSTDYNDEFKELADVDAVNIMNYILEKNIISEDYKSSLSSNDRNYLEKIEKVGVTGKEAQAISIIEKTINNPTDLHKNIIELRNKKLDSPIGTAQAKRYGKGYVQEWRVAAMLNLLAKRNANIGKKELGNIETSFPGTVDLLLETVAEKENFYSAILTGKSTKGKNLEKVTTDVSLKFKPVNKSEFDFNIDIKSSINKAYSSNRIISVPIPYKDNKAMRNAAYGIMNAAVFKDINSQYMLKSPVFKSLVLETINTSEFLDHFLIQEMSKPAGNFQHAIVVNNAFYWYSDLIKSLINYYVFESESTVFPQTFLENTEALRSTAVNLQPSLMKLKLGLLKRIKRKNPTLDYAGRYRELKKMRRETTKTTSITLEDAFKQHYDAFKSISMRFKIYVDISKFLQ